MGFLSILSGHTSCFENLRILPRFCSTLEHVCMNLDMKIQNLDYTYEYVDVRNKINIDIISLNISSIYNLAAIHKTPGHLPDEYYETNIIKIIRKLLY